MREHLQVGRPAGVLVLPIVPVVLEWSVDVTTGSHGNRETLG